MTKDFKLQNNFRQIKTGIIIAILVGIATATFFLIVEKESYSAIYLVPDSLIHDSNKNTVYYAYGITSSEYKKIDYTVDTYLGDGLIKTKQFSLNTGETLEEGVNTILPADVQYPVKITLTLKNGLKNESVYFWINNQTF